MPVLRFSSVDTKSLSPGFSFPPMSIAEKKETDAYAAPGDVAASPDSSSIAEFAGINEKSLLRKLDLRLLPPLTLLYLLSFLDRSNGLSPSFPNHCRMNWC
jgi:hypothetical protein